MIAGKFLLVSVMGNLVRYILYLCSRTSTSWLTNLACLHILGQTCGDANVN